MAGYISEFQNQGGFAQEFIEIALPAGTDPAGYTIEIYDQGGNLIASYPLGSVTSTANGHDVYVIDASTPGYDDGSGDPDGNLYPGDAIALVDGSGGVDQFISYGGSTVTPSEGAASGMTSTDVGTPGPGQSMQSDDGGSTYYAQSSQNSGTIPACYEAGSMIATPDGPKPIETLRPGSRILTQNGRTDIVKWVWSHTQSLKGIEADKNPVLISADALGPNRPAQELVVSGQHRVVVGAFGQLEDCFDQPQMIPAKSLVLLPGIRFMEGRDEVLWYHILCEDHTVVFANELASETLLLGKTFIQQIASDTKAHLSALLGKDIGMALMDRTVFPCLSVRHAHQRLCNSAVL